MSAAGNRTIMITGTDTNVGKTWLTVQAVLALRQAGLQAMALKPVACGSDANGCFEDINALCKAQGIKSIDAVNLYRFAAASAPNQAAIKENQQLDPARLTAWCRQAGKDCDVTLIEGVGGLMVPLTTRYLVSDWLADMPACDVWLVVGCRLGSINHALLSLSLLSRMGRSPKHIFLNAPRAEDQPWLAKTRQAMLPFVDKNSEIHTLSHQLKVDHQLNFTAML